jgi:hypothetical protein
LFQFLAYAVPYFIVEAIAKLRERFVIQYAPDYAVIEREVPALELADAVISLAVLHIQKTEIRKNPYEDGTVLARNLTVERVSGKCGEQSASTALVMITHHVLLCGVYLQDACLKSLVNEFLFNKTVCYHILIHY